MAKAGLTTYVELEVSAEGAIRPLHGVSKIESRGRDGILLTLGSIDLPDNIEAPEGSMTALFGFRGATEELSARKGQADARGSQFFMVEIGVEIGDLKPGAINPDVLSRISLLHLGRINNELQNLVMSCYNRYLHEDGLPHIGRISDIGKMPRYLSRLVQEPMFKHIDVVVYNIERESSLLPVASIFRTGNVLAPVRVDASPTEAMNHYFRRKIGEKLGRNVLQTESLVTVGRGVIDDAFLREAEADPEFVDFGYRFKPHEKYGVCYDWDGLWNGEICCDVSTSSKLKLIPQVPKLPLDES